MREENHLSQIRLWCAFADGILGAAVAQNIPLSSPFKIKVYKLCRNGPWWVQHKCSLTVSDCSARWFLDAVAFWGRAGRMLVPSVPHRTAIKSTSGIPKLKLWRAFEYWSSEVKCFFFLLTSTRHAFKNRNLQNLRISPLKVNEK